jgi:YHS domain-containing protein
MRRHTRAAGRARVTVFGAVGPEETTPMHDEPRGMAVDPICGDEVDADRTCFELVYQGDMYYFCSLECQVAFLEEPRPSANAHA